MESLIEEQLRMIAPRGKASFARQQLEGWWWPRVCAALQAEVPAQDRLVTALNLVGRDLTDFNANLESLSSYE